MDPLELGLKAFVNLVGAGNGNWVLCKSSQLSHLTTPKSHLYVDFFCICVSLYPSYWKKGRREGRKEGREGKEEEMKKGEGKSEGVTAVVGGPQRPHLAGQATVGAIYSQGVIEQIQASQAQTESRILAVREAH